MRQSQFEPLAETPYFQICETKYGKPILDRVINNRTDSYSTECQMRIADNDPYFNTLRKGWSEGLKRVFAELPDPGWC